MGEARLIGRNLSSLTLAQLITQLLILVVSIVLARSLGVEQYGIFVFGFAFPSWFIVFVSLGLDSVYAIEVAADRGKAGQYLTTIALLRLPLVGIAVLFLWVFTNLALADPFARTVTLLLGIAGVLQTYAGTFTAVFRAFERIEFDAFALVTERLVTTALVVLFLVLGRSLLEISIVYVAGGILILTLSMVLVRRSFIWFSRPVDRQGLSTILRLATPFALMAVVVTFTNAAGPVLLTVLLNPIATGQYNAALNIYFAFISFLAIYHLVLLPTMARMGREAPERLSGVLQQTQKLAFIFGLAAALGGWLYAEEIMTLFYGEAFRDSARSLAVLVFAVALSTAVLGNGTALAATGHQTLNLLIGSAGAATVLSLDFALIPTYGHVGAAYAVLAATVLIITVQFVAVRRLVARVNPLATYGRTVVAGIAMFLLLFFLPSLPLLFGALLGASGYFLLLFVTRGITREDWNVVKEALQGAFFRR